MCQGSETWPSARMERGAYPLDVVFEPKRSAVEGWRWWGKNLPPWILACSVHFAVWAAAHVDRNHRTRDQPLPSYEQTPSSIRPILIEALPMPQILADQVHPSNLDESAKSLEVQDSSSNPSEAKQNDAERFRPRQSTKATFEKKIPRSQHSNRREASSLTLPSEPSSPSKEHTLQSTPKLLATSAPAKTKAALESEPMDLSTLGSKSFEAVSWEPSVPGATVLTANGGSLGSASTSTISKQNRGGGRKSLQPSHAKLRQPVRLEADQWSCPWPKEAMQADIYKESVVLRVLVRSDGTVEETHLLEDPGFGFGSTAVQCARKTKFSPALNRKGQAVRALSPAIRVSFVR